MSTPTGETLFYEIVIDAASAINAMRQIGEAGASFEEIVKSDETFINELMETYSADAGVIASVMKKMNADISASERERIKQSTDDEYAVAAALDEERGKYVALDAAISQAAANVKALAGEQAAGAGILPPEDNFKALVADVGAATQSLNEMRAAGMSNEETVSALAELMPRMAAEYDVDISVIVDLFKQMGIAVDLDDAAMARLAERASQLNMAANINAATKALQEENDAGIELGSTLRMIEGVIVSMAVFQGIQMIGQVFSDATKNATEYYQALQNITAAQAALAQQGTAVTNQQMLDIATQLQQKWQTVSQVDMVAAVAQGGLMASEYGLSVSQMTQLVDQAAILHQLDPSKPMADYVTQLARALEGGKSLAANGEQIAITTEELKNKAVELGLVQEGSKAALTDQQKILAAMAIEQERLAPEGAKLTQEIKDGNSVLVQNEEATAKWKDETTAMGQTFLAILTVIKSIGVEIGTHLYTWFQIYQNVALMVDKLIAANPVVQTMGAILYTIEQIMTGNVKSAQDLVKAFQDGQGALQGLLDKYAQLVMFQNTPNPAASGQDMSNVPPSPGGGVGGIPPAIDTSKVPSLMDTAAKDYQTYANDQAKAAQEFQNKMQDMADRYNLDVLKEEQSTNLRMAQEKQDFRLKELQQEQDFQQKMRELTSRYELDLEDALRKRDAEAVIKVIEKYNLEKDTAQQQESLKQQQDKQNEQLKLQQMKQDEQLRLQQMKEEYDLQQQQAQRSYAQQQQDLTKALDQKLQEEAVKAGQDLNLNQNGINAIYKLFQEYYGPDGKFAASQNSSYLTMIAQSQGFVTAMATIMAQYGQVMATASAMTGIGTFSTAGAGTPASGAFGEGAAGGGYGSYGAGGAIQPAATSPSSHRYATGGMALASSATNVTFGEAGPELAMFLPLNSAGTPAGGGIGGGGGLLGGAGGQITIALQLSQDLEARIVNTTLTHAAIQIERVYGS